jgi:hypothetical protein
VNDLISRNYKVAGRHFPRLQVFGMELYNSSKNTLNCYSRFLRFNLRLDILLKQVHDTNEAGKNADWLISRLEDTGTILQQTQIYMETRFRQLDEYLQSKGQLNFVQLHNLKHDQKMKKFREELARTTRSKGTFLGVLLKKHLLN